MNVYIGEIRAGGKYISSASVEFEIPPNPSIAEINLSETGSGEVGVYAHGWIAYYRHFKTNDPNDPDFIDLEPAPEKIIDRHSMAADPQLMSVTFCLETHGTAVANLKVMSFPGGNFTRYP